MQVKIRIPTKAQAKLIHRALDCIGIERPIVFGHSLGTLTALDLDGASAFAASCRRGGQRAPDPVGRGTRPSLS